MPATIRLENIDSEKVWQYLVEADPLFTRKLPPTEGAIKLYESYINKYLRSVGHTDITASGSVTGSNPRFAVIFEAISVPAEH